MVLGIGAGLVLWKNKVALKAGGDFSGISQGEIDVLVADVAKQNPVALKRLGEDPKMRKEQLDNLKQLLAFASQAQIEGLANKSPNRQELVNIRQEVTATTYDKEINADKGPMPPFGFIEEEQVRAFWGEGEQPERGVFRRIGDAIGLGKRDNEFAFQRFLDTKVTLLKEANPAMKDREISDEEREQAKDFFARMSIYEQEYNDKLAKGEISDELRNRVNLQVKLQQAQFLARVYSDVAAEKIKVTDEDIDKYIAENPEFDVTEKRNKAEEILARAKGGEDFASLANEFSDDPGNDMGEEGKKRGGLYEKVRLGQMVKPFEEASLALEPGQVAPNLVESDFGFHIIKLEKKEETEGEDGEKQQTYDVRHVLVSTGVKDDSNPFGREMPIRSHVRQKLEKDRQEKLINDIVARHNIQVPDDFTVPEITEEQIEEAMKQQQRGMPLPQGHSEDDGHGH